jgi:hypothetical protein
VFRRLIDLGEHMPVSPLIAWDVERTGLGAAAVRACPSCGERDAWESLREERRLRIAGTAVGRTAIRRLVACGACGCALPAGWREAQRWPTATPAAG